MLTIRDPKKIDRNKLNKARAFYKRVNATEDSIALLQKKV